MSTKKRQQRIKRHKRIRSRISGAKDRPRLAVFRSLKSIYAQLIDDESGKVIAQSSSLKTKKRDVEAAKEVGYTTVGVLTGFYLHEAMKPLCDYIIDSVADINSLL